MLKANDVFCSMCGKWMRSPSPEDYASPRDTAHFCEFECAQLFYANLEKIRETEAARRVAGKGKPLCLVSLSR
jgi:hypothetical protein